MAKKNKVTQARRAYVQSRAESTGKTSASDRAQFRQRFEKLASTKAGRAKIQEVTGISGIRKDLRSAYSAPKSNTQKLTDDSSSPKSSLPGFGVAAKRTYTEAQTEMKLRANPTPYKASVQKYSVDVTPTQVSRPSNQSSGLNNTQKVLLAGGATGVGALALRRMRLDAIDRANQAKSAAAKKASASAPKASSKPINRKTTGPRSSSLSAKTSTSSRSNTTRSSTTSRGSTGVRGGAGVRGGQYGQGGRGGGGFLKRTK